MYLLISITSNFLILHIHLSVKGGLHYLPFYSAGNCCCCKTSEDDFFFLIFFRFAIPEEKRGNALFFIPLARSDLCLRLVGEEVEASSCDDKRSNPSPNFGTVVVDLEDEDSFKTEGFFSTMIFWLPFLGPKGPPDTTFVFCRFDFVPKTDATLCNNGLLLLFRGRFTLALFLAKAS